MKTAEFIVLEIFLTIDFVINKLLLYRYKFSRSVIFEVFVVNWCEIFILKISLANFDLHELESRILGNSRN